MLTYAGEEHWRHHEERGGQIVQRWELKAGLILLGWGPVEAALELGTSLGTIQRLETGDLHDVLSGPVIERARAAFEARELAIRPPAGEAAEEPPP